MSNHTASLAPSEGEREGNRSTFNCPGCQDQRRQAKLELCAPGERECFGITAYSHDWLAATGEAKARYFNGL